jgi:nitrilase
LLLFHRVIKRSCEPKLCRSLNLWHEQSLKKPLVILPLPLCGFTHSSLNMSTPDLLKVGLAQIAPSWLNRVKTLDKVASYVSDAAAQRCDLVAFGEALAPGYPFWTEFTDGAKFNNAPQKAMYATYLDQGVVIERGDLDAICKLCKQHKIAVYLGVMERPPDRGGHSLYCSLVYINQAGDGHGLVVHELGAFKVGGLNCFENWVPLLRSALYAQGEDLHVSVWPGGLHNTKDLTRFIAQESRSYVIAVSGLLRVEDIPADMQFRDELIATGKPFFANGGTALAAPNGEWVIEPQVGKEGLFTAEIDHKRVREERHNFDLAGHYGRPDVTQLVVDRARQSTVRFKD